MSMNIDQVKAVMADREFVETIVAMEDPVDVQKAFADKGIDFTVDQINQIAELALNHEGEELTDAELESVSGGAILEIITVVAGGVALFANVMSEVNKSRKEQGKSTIW